MRKIYVLIICLLLSSQFSFSQDWQCFQNSATSYFDHQTRWVIRTDSVKQIGVYSYYYFLKSPAVSGDFSTPWLPYGQCIDPLGPSRAGKYMVVGNGFNFFFNSSGDTIRIMTLLQPGIPWRCCRISDSSYLDAVVTQFNIETVLGITDSVKEITFQARDLSGNPLNHPMNGLTMKIAKQLGLLTLFDFNQFPAYDGNATPVHQLSGFHSLTLSLGESKITWRSIYEFSPGDEFHTEYRPYWTPHGSSHTDSTICIVLDSVWSPALDTVSYHLLRYNHVFDAGFGTSKYSRDTLTVSYSSWEGFSPEPEESFLSYSPEGKISAVSSMIQLQSAGFNSHWQLLPNSKADITSGTPCSDSLLAGNYWQPSSENYISYVDGCGGPYYYDCTTDPFSSDWTCRSYRLLYFRKGTETWGTALDTTGWNLPPAGVKIEKDFKIGFKISPNPAHEYFRILIKENNIRNYRLEIFSVQGIKLDETFFNTKDCLVPTSKYSKGVYIIRVSADQSLLGQQKLIIE